MNDLTTTARLEEIAVGIEARSRLLVEQILEIGRLLCEARELLASDTQFGQWQERRLPWIGRETARRWMNAYRNDGEKLLQHNVGATSVYLLTAPSTPESARAEALERAESGEHLSVKATEEIVARHKAEMEALRTEHKEQVEAIKLRLDEAVRQTQPDQSRLIRELALMRKGGGISEGAAQAYSLLPEYLQRNILETLRERDRAQVDRQAAERNAAQAVANQQQAMAEAQQAKAEAEEAKRRSDEIAREGAQAVIDDLNARIETLKKQVERERETAWEDGKKAGIAQKNEAVEKQVAEMVETIARLERERDAARRKLSSAEGTMESMRRELQMEEARANGLQEQMEAAHPLAKDNIHAQVLAHMTEDLKAEIAKLEADCEPHQRKLSKTALEALSAVVGGWLDRQDAMLIEG